MKALTRWFALAGTTFALLLVAAGTGVLAIAFLSAALYLGLLEPLGMPLAALATGCVLAVAAAVFLLLLLRAKPREVSAPPADRPLAGELGELLGEQAGLWTRRHPGGAMLAALVAGFIVGSSPSIRARLLKLLG
jgi:hypothetical protein